MSIQKAQPLFVMRPVAEIEEYQNILVYGDFGSGKTHLAATAALVPEMLDVLYISLEGGEKTLKEIQRQMKAKGVDPARLMVIPVTSYKQYAYVFEFLKTHIQFRDAGDDDRLRQLEAQVKGYPAEILRDVEKLRELIPNPLKIKTVINDSITEAQKYCMYQLLGIDPAKQKLDAEPDAPQFAEWGRSREMIQFLVRRFRDLPVHSIFIAGHNVEQDAKKQFHYDLMLPGQLAKDVRGLVDTVGYLMAIPMEGGNIGRRLFLVPGMYSGAHLAAKHRYGSNLKGLWVDNPNMQMLYDLGKE